MAEEEDYDQRAHMESVIASGGSVYHKGQIITHRDQLPSHGQLAKGDARREAAAREVMVAQRDALDRALAELDSGSTAYKADERAAQSGAPGTGDDDGEELPEDFPARAALIEAGIETYADVSLLSDENLTGIRGVGPATAEKIRQALK
jgi:hypothetical protein